MNSQPKVNPGGRCRESKNHEFFTPACESICHNLYEAVRRTRLVTDKNREHHRLELIRQRLALLREHQAHCHDPERLARFRRSINYQLQLMERPQAVFNPFIRT